MAKRTEYEKWQTLRNNTKLAVQLGFAIHETSLWINKLNKSVNKPQYSKCDLTKIPVFVGDHYEERRKTSKQTIFASNFGKEPVFDQFRKYKSQEKRKRGNTIAPIQHPNLWAYDFDVHDGSPAKILLLQEIFTRLCEYSELLIGYAEGFKGLHVFCTTAHKWIVEQEVEIFKQTGGHIDIFNHAKNNGIGIPGFDHYFYKKQNILRFIKLLDVKIYGKISVYQSQNEQRIKYPKPIILPQEILKRQKPYKDASANIKLHLDGIKNRIVCNKTADNTNDIEYINSLMANVGHRTPFLLSSKGHKLIIRYLTHAQIDDIEIFKTQFPDFEDNHYALIEQLIECAQDSDRTKSQKHIICNTDYAREVKDLRASTEQWFKSKDLKCNQNLLSVATYLANCLIHNICSPGYVHYVEFCKMNEYLPVRKSTYFDQVKKCEDYKWISIPNNTFYMVGKMCREIEKGSLFKDFIKSIFEITVCKYKRIKQETNKVFNYIEANNTYNIYIHNIKTIPLLPIILCSPKNLNLDSLAPFNMNNFYSLRL